MQLYEKYLTNKILYNFEFGRALDDLFKESLQNCDNDKSNIISTQVESKKLDIFYSLANNLFWAFKIYLF